MKVPHLSLVTLALSLALAGCEKPVDTPAAESNESPMSASTLPERKAKLSDAQVEDIVRRSYQYVAMYNVNNKFAMRQGWNSCVADTTLKDHTMTDIARPNNDSLYISCMLDLRTDPVIIEYPAFDSKYVSLMVTGYDHYVNVPLSVTKGDFGKPEKVLFYTERTEGYEGEPVGGVDRVFEMSGDFLSAVFRVMPHANDPERFDRIKEQMQSVRAVTLSEFQGGEPEPVEDTGFPPVGATDTDVYANNFLDVMQFVVNHTTFHPDDPVDAALLTALEPLGIQPGKTNNTDAIEYEPGRFVPVVESIREEEFRRMFDPAQSDILLRMFKTKGKIGLEALLFQSVIGPIGLPATEAVYPAVVAEGGGSLNAMHDYVIRMDKDQLPPARAFWSLTLYDSANGFFIPNDRKKYSVGENGGMQLDDQGGIAIYVSADKPEGVPEDNWLPISRKDEDIDLIMRIYVPDLKAYKNYQVPKAQRLPEK